MSLGNRESIKGTGVCEGVVVALNKEVIVREFSSTQLGKFRLDFAY